MPTKKEIEILKNEFEDELFNSVIPFWENYSIDKINGGYYNCLDRDGKVYDPTKYVWLLARQVWMFSKLYNKVEQKESWLKIAEHGLDFLKRNALTESKRVYFSLNKKGDPIYLQRKIFSECFYTMALAEYSKAIGSNKLLNEAKEMLDVIWDLSSDPGKVGRAKLKGNPGLKTLAVPMIMLNLIEEVAGDDYSIYQAEIERLIDEVEQHFINGRVYENIKSDGSIHNSSEGRLLNPGHAIEAGWFLKHWARKLKNSSIDDLADKIIRRSFDIGWDEKYGGLFYFLDAEGYSPTQLEWNMKLWWVHTEAIYANLLLYSGTKSELDWKRFIQVKEYSFNHFRDKKYGEWFGYLDRVGNITHQFKGGPYKGFFHIPRALLYSITVFEKILNDGNEK